MDRRLSKAEYIKLEWGDDYPVIDDDKLTALTKKIHDLNKEILFYQDALKRELIEKYGD